MHLRTKPSASLKRSHFSKSVYLWLVNKSILKNSTLVKKPIQKGFNYGRKRNDGGKILVRLTRQRRNTLSALGVLVLLVLGINLVGYGVANPYAITGEVPPDQETYPPVITITSPVNNTSYNTSRVPLTFNVTAPQSRTASFATVIRVTYEADWKNEAIDVLYSGQEQPSFNLQLSNVPEGQHSIVIKAVGSGLYLNEKELSAKEFRITSTVTICFTIDRTAPTVLVLPPENVSSASAVPLNLTVNEAYSRIDYSLNGQQNVTVSGNSTLPHLASGYYNLTFYVWDFAGNVGSSETVNFSVVETPNTTEEVDASLFLPAVAVTSMVVVVGVGLLLYKRR